MQLPWYEYVWNVSKQTKSGLLTQQSADEKKIPQLDPTQILTSYWTTSPSRPSGQMTGCIRKWQPMTAESNLFPRIFLLPAEYVVPSATPTLMKDILKCIL